MLVDQQWTWRENQAPATRLHAAKLKGACVEEIDYRARADGSLRSLLVRLSRIDVLVIDDWAMAPLADAERRDFWEICEDRYQARSTILTSQLPVARWHGQIGDPTAADGILDRLVHNAHRIEMRGDSMRKNRGKPNA
jgi:DNA replication protein DnaC